MRIFKYIAFVAFLLLAFQRFWSQTIRVDHVVKVTKDYGGAVESYKQLGFTIKDGRLHDNGIRNGFIKFSNQSYLEFIAIEGHPKDSLAMFYQKMIEKGQGKGAFLALTGINTSALIDTLNDLNITFNLKKTSFWNIISFPNEPALEHLFFIDYHKNIVDNPLVYQHKNSAYSLSGITIEGYPMTLKLFEALGLKHHELTNQKHLIITKTGDINLALKTVRSQRLRIVSVSFKDKLGQDILNLGF